ncbi:hypothetical protein GCM10029978_067720 [Actinoallomurus acanthiterrae]
MDPFGAHAIGYAAPTVTFSLGRAQIRSGVIADARAAPALQSGRTYREDRDGTGDVAMLDDRAP